MTPLHAWSPLFPFEIHKQGGVKAWVNQGRARLWMVSPVGSFSRRNHALLRQSF